MGTDCLDWSLCASAMAFYLSFYHQPFFWEARGSVVSVSNEILCGLVQIDRLQINIILDSTLHIYTHLYLYIHPLGYFYLRSLLGKTFWFHCFIGNYQGAAFLNMEMRDIDQGFQIPRRRHRKKEKTKTYRK
jgi:hypothetical protein